MVSLGLSLDAFTVYFFGPAATAPMAPAETRRYVRHPFRILLLAKVTYGHDDVQGVIGIGSKVPEQWKD